MLPSALGSQKGQKRAPRRPQKPQNAPKIPNAKGRVAVVKNRNNVVKICIAQLDKAIFKKISIKIMLSKTPLRKTQKYTLTKG